MVFLIFRPLMKASFHKGPKKQNHFLMEVAAFA